MSRTLALFALSAILTSFSGCSPGVTELKRVDLKIGTGPEAVPGTTVTVHYTGWLYEGGKRGKKFDSSRDGGGSPFPFRLGADNVIQGWHEGIPGMRVGGRRRLIIPPALGYGSEGAPPDIPPNAALEFEVELLHVSN